MGGGDADTDTTDSTGTTEACEPAYVVTDHECPHFSAADGEGPGGGETLSSCAKVDTKSGHLQVFVRKWYGADDPVFEDRPYMIRVSGVDTDPCGPDAFYFVISNDTPTGIGTDQLVFTFSSTWLDDQGPKGYCVTAALLPDEPEYIEGTPHNQSWWFSDKFWLESVCE